MEPFIGEYSSDLYDSRRDSVSSAACANRYLKFQKGNQLTLFYVASHLNTKKGPATRKSDPANSL